MSRDAAATAERETPVSNPQRSHSSSRDSVARFPGLPGAKGHPPNPPQEASKRLTPSCSARSAQAMAVPEVSCR